ncbi:hypothetical protein CR513_52548, partial [Mucuna pruriens]
MNEVTTPSRSIGIKSSHSSKVQHQLQVYEESLVEDWAESILVETNSVSARLGLTAQQPK